MVNHFVSHECVKALKASHPDVRRLKRQGHHASHHGNKVWRSSFVLIDYLSERDFPAGTRVLDVGCGWGLSGIFMARQFSAEVTGIDIDSNVAPFLALQASVNNCEVQFQQKSIDQMSGRELAKFDAIIGADICFWDEMTDTLHRFVKRAVKAGVPFIAIADPGRPPFWELAARCEQRLAADTFTRTITEPLKTTKHIMVVEA